MTAISEEEDLAPPKLVELIESLFTHEMILSKDGKKEEKEPNPQGLSFKWR